MHEIADSQSLSLPTNNTNTQNQNQTQIPKNTKNTCSVLKCIEDGYNDSVSNLNGYIIDLIGSFLTKKESILFGYLNKQLYTETQKLSYLLQRWAKQWFCNEWSICNWSKCAYNSQC